jgi:hypothetical protein
MPGNADYHEHTFLHDLGDLLLKIAEAEVIAITLDLPCQKDLAVVVHQLAQRGERQLWDHGLLLGSELADPIDGRVLGVVTEIAADPYGSSDFYVHYERAEGARDRICMIDIDLSDPTSVFWRLPGSGDYGVFALAGLLQWHGKTQERLAANEMAGRSGASPTTRSTL